MKKTMLRAAVAVAALAAAPQAHAVSFILNGAIDTSTTAGAGAQRGFQIATAYWSSVLTDNFTSRLNVGFRSLAPNVLAQAGSSTVGVLTSGIYGALAGDASSGVDATAVANLRPLTTNSAGQSFVTATVNAFNATNNGYIDTATRIDNDQSANNRVLDVNRTVFKALGGADNGLADGSITFSSDFAFDFDPTDGIDAGAFDFIGVAIHEIGHILGFVSGVDTYDFFTSPGQTNTNPGGLEAFRVASVLDLFRYSAPGTLDWSTQNTPYFSIDGGANQLYGNSLFSQGQFNGDSRQASHWKDAIRADPQLGIMDPTSGRGQLQEVTGLDLAAFDAIGFNLRSDVRDNGAYRFTTADAFRTFAAANPAVPEPATWVMMIAGFGLMGASMRTQRRRTTVRFAA